MHKIAKNAIKSWPKLVWTPYNWNWCQNRIWHSWIIWKINMSSKRICNGFKGEFNPDYQVFSMQKFSFGFRWEDDLDKSTKFKVSMESWFCPIQREVQVHFKQTSQFSALFTLKPSHAVQSTFWQNIQRIEFILVQKFQLPAHKKFAWPSK